MIGWVRQLTEIRDALRALPAHLAEAQSNDGRSIRDLVEEIETRVESPDREDEREDDLAEVRVAPARPGRIPALEARVSDLERTVKILCDRTHESSLHVAGPVLATPDLPAAIMQGTPDTDPSGDGDRGEPVADTAGSSTHAERAS